MRRCLGALLILGSFLTLPTVSRAEELTPPPEVNEDVQGLDLGIINKPKGIIHGFELGAFNAVKKEFNGVQLGLIANVTRGSFEGFQAAVFYNDAQEEMHGLQLGIVNHAGFLAGVQIGILNFNDDTTYLGFFPFINAEF